LRLCGECISVAISRLMAFSRPSTQNRMALT
jgi:hypothetical protein